ncbi:hypothetical protein E4U43_003715 [Claviceps pusilla]|uniref:Uncharacterized protein n=1 Tax=Claviceps pusilla TaxID=123648 RepID=A0A9P7NHC1_9HYPO|nr:hypothetical protein E4U43_003715 [Claviceps pusilla]
MAIGFFDDGKPMRRRSDTPVAFGSVRTSVPETREQDQSPSHQSPFGRSGQRLLDSNQTLMDAAHYQEGWAAAGACMCELCECANMSGQFGLEKVLTAQQKNSTEDVQHRADGMGVAATRPGNTPLNLALEDHPPPGSRCGGLAELQYGTVRAPGPTFPSTSGQCRTTPHSAGNQSQLRADTAGSSLARPSARPQRPQRPQRDLSGCRDCEHQPRLAWLSPVVSRQAAAGQGRWDPRRQLQSAVPSVD